MRQVVASLLLVGSFFSHAAAFQARAGAAPGGKPPISACSLLSKEIVEKFLQNKAALAYMKPEEQALGAKGSTCEWGTIGLQVDPFARPDEIRKSLAKEGWEAVTGLGDAAYFRNNRDRYAELIVWTGAHHFTIQMGINTGRTAASTKPDTIAVANSIIPRLR